MKKIKKKRLPLSDSSSRSSSSVDLPSFEAPPVNEVVCGMRFNPPDALRLSHIGLLWNKFRKDYPIVQHAVPIASAKGDLMVDSATGLPLQRVWFINPADDQLIQFQFDRFYFNWRQRNSNYPRYSYIIKHFEHVRTTMIDFFKEFELGELKPIEYELSYINHIPIEQGWKMSDELLAIFSDFAWGSSASRFLPNPEKIAWKAEFSLRDNMGRLSVSLKQGTRTEDQVALLILELRVFCPYEPVGSNVRQWFDLAHEWIVKGFTDLTTPEAHKNWKRER